MIKSYYHPDLHLHSFYSDGTDSPKQLITKAKAAGVDLFSLTDHDTVRGCEEIVLSLKKDDPAFLRGVEFSCEDREGKYHILGYGFDRAKPAVEGLAEHCHQLRIEKAQKRFAFLRERFGFCFSDKEEQTVLLENNPGKPHFVELMMQKGLISEKKAGFELFQDCPEDEFFLSPELAIEAIRCSEGVAVLAHGIFSDGSIPLSEEQLRKRVERLQNVGLQGLECFYPTYSEQQRKIMLSAAADYQMFITAGSDYHGKNKNVCIGESIGAEQELLSPFYSAVAHQIIEY